MGEVADHCGKTGDSDVEKAKMERQARARAKCADHVRKKKGDGRTSWKDSWTEAETGVCKTCSVPEIVSTMTTEKAGTTGCRGKPAAQATGRRNSR